MTTHFESNDGGAAVCGDKSGQYAADPNDVEALDCLPCLRWLADSSVQVWHITKERNELLAALQEIARPKRGGIESNDSDQEWFDYLRGALERERETARKVIAKYSEKTTSPLAVSAAPKSPPE